MSNLFFSGKEPQSEVESKLWQKLAASAKGEGSNFKIATLATSAADFPQQRSIVLRDVNTDLKQLFFFTDVRSEKITELSTNPKVGLHFWDEETKVQLRLNGTMRYLQNGAVADKYFKDVPETNYAEYATMETPGSHLKDPEKKYAVVENLAHRHFAVLHFQTERLEALQLNGNHHYRIEFFYTDGESSSQWLMP